MIKNKIILFLLISIFSTQSSFPLFAVGSDDDTDIPLSQVPIKLKENKDRIKELEKENASIKKVLEDTQKDKEDLQYFQKRKDYYKKKTEQLEKELLQTDNLIEFLLSEEATPTALTFLRAVYEGKTREERKDLFRDATSKKEIRDVIVDGCTKFKASAPEASMEILKVTGLVNNMKITQDNPTITYAKVTIPGTPEKELKKHRDAVDSSKRRNSENQFQ
jgi:hypothetical protein